MLHSRPRKIVTEYINEAETDYVHQNLTESVFLYLLLPKMMLQN